MSGSKSVKSVAGLICSVDQCGKPVRAKGYCQQHYARLKRYNRTNKIRGLGGTCSVKDCGKPVDSLGYCTKHYQRWHKYGRVEKTRTGDRRSHPMYRLWWERKRSNILCDAWLDFGTFIRDVGESSPGSNYFLARISDTPFGPDNFEWREHLRRAPGESKKAWHARKWKSRRERFPDYETNRWYLRKYGITSDQYDQMCQSQNGKCAICTQPETSFESKSGTIKRLSVDHCHATGAVRGLLCFRCNSVIGKAGDSVTLLESMVSYLKRHDGNGNATDREHLVVVARPA